MLREVGVPARLVTGFVTGDLDPITGRYQVRASDAHAWAEVWFPGVGWQGFDPTASVPLAGESAAPTSVFTWLRDHLAIAVVGLAALGAVTMVVIGLRRRWRARRDRVVPSWAAARLADLERIGRGADRPRSPAETPSAYAADLAARLAEPELVRVGAAIDADGFGATPIDESTRADTTAIVRRLLDSD
jgi:hypothetical protein